MPQDDISALNAKMDFLIGSVNDLRKENADQSRKITSLEKQFDQAMGAVWLIKTAVWITVGAATIWASIHMGK